MHDIDIVYIYSHLDDPRTPTPIFFSYSLTYITSQIYAVYDRNKLILFVMAVLFAANIASTALIIYVGPPGGKIMV